MMPEKARKKYELEKRLEAEIPGVLFWWDMWTGNTLVYLPGEKVTDFVKVLGYIDGKTVEFIKES